MLLGTLGRIMLCGGFILTNVNTFISALMSLRVSSETNNSFYRANRSDSNNKNNNN